jgi:hypothetical protein
MFKTIHFTFYNEINEKYFLTKKAIFSVKCRPISKIKINER